MHFSLFARCSQHLPAALPVVSKCALAGSFFRCRFCTISADKGKTIRTTLRGSAIIRKGKRVRKFKRGGVAALRFSFYGQRPPVSNGGGLAGIKTYKDLYGLRSVRKTSGFFSLIGKPQKARICKGFRLFCAVLHGSKMFLVCNCFFGVGV